MNITYIARRQHYNDLKTKLENVPTNEIKSIYCDKTKEISEFQCLENIEYLYYEEEPEFGKMLELLMNKRSFNTDTLADSLKIYEEYRNFNQKIAKQINNKEKDDLVIVNDYNLLFLAEFLECKIAVRKIKFDHFFIYRMPFYKNLMECLSRDNTNIFFDDVPSFESFNNFFIRDFDFEDASNSHYIDPYIDRELVLEALSDSKLVHNINEVCCDGNKLLDVEPMILKNPNLVINVLRLDIDLNINADRMIQYFQKTYRTKVRIINHSKEFILALLRSETYIGSQYRNHFKLLSPKFNFDKSDKDYVLNEIEYLEIFLELLDLCIFNNEDAKMVKSKSDSIDIKLNEIKYLLKNNRNADFSLNTACDENCSNQSTCGSFESKFTLKPKSLEAGNQCDCMQCDYKLTHCKTTSQFKNKKYGLASYMTDETVEGVKILKKFLLDYDGTLSHIQPSPWMAIPTKEIIELLLKHKDRILLCTGRSMEVVDEWFPVGIRVYAEHGALFRDAEGKWLVNIESNEIQSVEDFSRKHPINDNVLEILKYYEKRTPNSLVEKKLLGYAFHYRQSDTYGLQTVIRQLYKDLAKVKDVYNFIISKGHQVIEIKKTSKAAVVMKENPCVVAGDDIPDEDMFNAAKTSCLTIKVGNVPTRATYYVNDVDDFISKLLKLLEKTLQAVHQ